MKIALIMTALLAVAAPAHASDGLLTHPATRTGSPLVVVVHGGGWVVGSAGQIEGRAADIQASGAAVVNVSYRLATADRAAFPMQVDDVMAGVRWAVQHAGQLNADPRNVTIVGGSAGGHLAAESALRLNARQPGMVDNVVLLSPATNLVSLVRAADAGQIRARFAGNIRTALAGCDVDCQKRWSPAWKAASAPCANWVIYQSVDELMPRAQYDSMVARLRNAGCRVDATLVPGNTHGWALWPQVRERVRSLTWSTRTAR